MANKKHYTMATSITDFDFMPKGYGHYSVTYTSPATGKTWTAIITHMPIIDATRYSDAPLRKNLEELKRLCKLG